MYTKKMLSTFGFTSGFHKRKEKYSTEIEVSNQNKNRIQQCNLDADKLNYDLFGDIDIFLI